MRFGGVSGFRLGISRGVRRVKRHRRGGEDQAGRNPLEAIKERMAQLKLTQKDLAPLFGGENRVSEVLSGKRHLTVKMLIALHKHLNIPTETLLGVGRS